MTEEEATLAAQAVARHILGPRARVFREGDQYMVARHELLLSGLSHAKVYGVGDTWAAALVDARASYRRMRDNPTKGMPQHEA